MLGFLGAFSVNYEIPGYWGIGKSVSRGLGTGIKTEYRIQTVRNQTKNNNREQLKELES